MFRYLYILYATNKFPTEAALIFKRIAMNCCTIYDKDKGQDITINNPTIVTKNDKCKRN